MSSSVGISALYDTSPVSSGIRRGSSIRRRTQSSPGGLSDPGMGFAFRSTSSRAARAVGTGPPSFVGSYGSRASTTTHDSARYADELYENYFIGSTKIPKNQNQIMDPEEVSRIEKMNTKIEKESELVSAIKKALGKEKKATKYPNKVASRQYSGVLAERANSTTPNNFWTTAEVNAYRMRKM